jgi:glucokinase
VESALGLDIGGTKLAAGVVAPDGEVRSFAATATHREQGPAAGIARLFDLARKVCAEAGVAPADLVSTGIGCGGPLDRDAGMLREPLHLPGWRDVPVTALAERELGPPATLDNDGTAAALGEHRFGAGRGVDNLVYLTVSTGIGGGLVLRGQPYRGASGNAGELGHVTVERGGRRCRGCGRRGCLEAYASGTSIAERAVEAGVLCGQPTAADVVAAVRAGDPGATALWDSTVDAMVCGVASIVNAFDPELVVIGGGVSRAGELLFDPLRAGLRAELPDVRARVVPALGGDRVGVVGAAAIAFEER